MLIHLAILPALISFSVLLGWILQWPLVVTPLPDGPPMVFNTALSIFALSLSILSSRFKILSFCKLAWVIPALLATLSGSQTLFEVNLHIDQVFATALASESHPHPGRIPGASAFCLLMASLGWGSLQLFPSSRVLFPVYAFSGFCSVLFLGLITMINALLLAPLQQSWQSFAQIPFHTGLCFLFIGFIGLIRSLRRVSSKESNRIAVYGALCGLTAFFMTILIWQYSLQKNASQIDLRLQKEVSMRVEKMTELLFERAEDFQKLKVPASFEAAQKIDWKPPFEAEAVVQLKPHPQLIWQKDPGLAERELALLSEQILPNLDFYFYPSFYFQRARWFAFSNQNVLVIFSLSDTIQTYFPEELFSYSLHWKDQLLASNITSPQPALVQWKKNWPLEVWDTKMILQVTPTQQLYNRLSTLNAVLFLLAGLGFSMFLGVGFVGLLYVKRRISR